MFKVWIDNRELRKLKRALRGLEPKIRKKILRKAMRAGLKPMLAKARALAPKGKSRMARGQQHTGGTMRKAIKIKSSRSRKGIRIAILIGAGSFKGEQFYGSFQEEGAKKANIKALHFLRRAFNLEKERSLEITRNEIRKGLESQ